MLKVNHEHGVYIALPGLEMNAKFEKYKPEILELYGYMLATC